MQNRSAFPALLLTIATVLISGCATINYDEQSDQQITSLTKEINEQLLTWEFTAQQSPKAATYDAKFYVKAEADLTALRIRMDADRNQATDLLDSNLSSLETQVEALRKVHQKDGYLTAAFAHAERAQLNAQLAVLTDYEVALKSGASASPSKASSGSDAAKAKKS